MISSDPIRGADKDPILGAWARQCRDRAGKILAVGHGARSTVEDVARLTTRLAAEARGRGLGARQVVLLCAANGPGFLAGLLALRGLDCVVVLADPRTPEAERKRLASAFGCTAALVLDSCWPGREMWRWNNDSDADRLGPRLPPLASDIAVLKVTSGTTGDPQAVTVTSEALVADEAALSVTMGITEKDRILAAIPLSHSYGLCSVALPALLRGCLLVVPEAGSLFAAMKVAKHHEVSFLPTVPAYLQGLVRASQPPPAPASLRLLVSAGAPLPPETAVAVRAIYRQPAHVFYGASECGGITFDRDGSAAERGTLGTPIEGVAVELESIDTGSDLPWSACVGSGERGVVRVRSPAVATGYYPESRPALGGGVFKTSDLGSWDHGELRLHGRVDAMLNVRGKNVDPLEVERLLQECAGVEEVAVVGIPDAAAAGSELVRAVVAGIGLRPDVLRQWCRERLAEHKVPRSVIVVDRLPRTERGKLDRRALTDMK